MIHIKRLFKKIILFFLRSLKFFGLNKYFNLIKEELTVDEYLKRSSGTYHIFNKILLQESYIHNEYPLIKLLNQEFNIKVKSLSLRIIEERFTLILKNGIVAGKNAAIITSSNVLLRDLSREFGNRDTHSITEGLLIPKVQKIDGTAAVILTAGSNTYYHWIFDILPRLGIIKDSGLESTVQFYVSSKIIYPFQKDTLTLLGIEEKQLLSIDNTSNAYEIEHLIVPSLPSKLGIVSKYAIQFLRKNFISETTVKNPLFKRIYISRKKANNRKLLNESEITEFLEQQGFRIVFPEEFTFKEQVEMFYSAEFIVAPHGSGLANIVFCNSTVKVLELFSSDFFVPCYMDLAAQLTIKYDYLFSNGVDNYPLKNYWEGLNNDFIIPIQFLKDKIFEFENN
jgi:hypothetical protein